MSRLPVLFDNFNNDKFLYNLDVLFFNHRGQPQTRYQFCDFCKWEKEDSVVFPFQTDFPAPYQREQHWNKVVNMLTVINKNSIDDWATAMKSYAMLRNNNMQNFVDAIGNYTDFDTHLATLDLLDKIAHLAVQLPVHFPRAVPICHINQNICLHLSQIQVACLLANAFFCTFETDTDELQRASLRPNINFARLYHLVEETKSVQQAKITTFFNYFRKFFSEEPNGTISYYRRKVSSRLLLGFIKPIPIEANQIELMPIDAAIGGDIDLLVDFTDSNVGGDILKDGCKAEETLYLTHPELVAARLFTQRLMMNECMFIQGTQQFSPAVTYGNELRYGGDMSDEHPVDLMRRRKFCVVVMDAKNYSSLPRAQFTDGNFHRDLSKILTAFLQQGHLDELEQNSNRILCECDNMGIKKVLRFNNCCDGSKITMTDWGCTEHAGDREYRFAMVLLAANLTKRIVKFHTNGTEYWHRRIRKFLKFIRTANLTAVDLYQRFRQFNHYIKTKKRVMSFFEFVIKIEKFFDVDVTFHSHLLSAPTEEVASVPETESTLVGSLSEQASLTETEPLPGPAPRPETEPRPGPAPRSAPRLLSTDTPLYLERLLFADEELDQDPFDDES